MNITFHPDNDGDGQTRVINSGLAGCNVNIIFSTTGADLECVVVRALSRDGMLRVRPLVGSIYSASEERDIPFNEIKEIMYL